MIRPKRPYIRIAMSPHTTSLTEQLAAAGLTDRQRDCLAMVVFDGLRHRQIAERLGVVRRVVTHHVAAARKKLAAIGLEASTVEHSARPRTITMDPHVMDQLDPADIRAKW